MPSSSTCRKVIFLSRLWHDIWAWIIYGGAILFSAVWLTLFLLFKKELKTVLLSTSFRPVKKLNESPFFALITGNYSACTALMSLMLLEVSIVRLYANGYSMWEMVSVIGAVFDGVVLFMGLYMIIKGALTYRKREAGMTSDSPHADSASFPDEKETAVAEPDASGNDTPLPAPPSDKKNGCGGSPPDAAENDPG